MSKFHLRKSITSGLSVLFVMGCASTAVDHQEEVAFDLDASAARMQAHIAYLSDDDKMGREPGEEGYNVSANYVAEQFVALGLVQAGEEGWFQNVKLRSSKRVSEAAHMSLSAKGQSSELVHLEDYLIGVPANGQATKISGDLVFVGYGLDAPDFGINDYEGLDVEGKIVVMLSGSSTDMPSDIAAHYNSSRTRRVIAEEKGAIGVISLYDQASAKRFPWERVVNRVDRASMSWARKDGTTFSQSQGIKLTATMAPEAGQKLFDHAEMSYEDVLAITEDHKARPKGFDLKISATLKADAKSEDVISPNVLAMLPGSDPKLKDEYIVISAHLDHVGHYTSDDPEEDTIRNGALDNSTGIATMLEAAKYLSEGKRPRRSIIFAAVTAEEKGLLGAEYFAYNPTVPQDQIVANVNLDMPIITYPFIDVIAFGADRSSLGEAVRNAAASMDVALIPDPVPQMSIFTRSDHYRFVQQGIPSVFLFLGFGNGGEEAFNDFMSNRYHQPGDDISQDIDYYQGARFAKLNYLIALSIANEEARPSWNEGDFFGELYAK